MKAPVTRRHRSVSRLKPGQTFGHWQVIRFVEMDKPGDYYFCRCVCGKEKAVEGGSLRKGTSNSCGCRMKNSARSVAGDAKSTGPETQAILTLIAQGYLPPADQFSDIDGSPCWSLGSIAMMLGLKLDELQQHLLNAGRRFSANGSGV